MENFEVEIDKIILDPNSPRKYIDEDHVEEMAQSMRSVGVINAIEVDKKFMIVTGEVRWRAAKMAGLKTIPAKIIEINDDERFMRQVIDNLHPETLSTCDKEDALEKLLTMWPGEKDGEVSKTDSDTDKKITWLSKKIGISRGYVDDLFFNLEAKKCFEKARLMKQQLKKRYGK